MIVATDGPEQVTPAVRVAQKADHPRVGVLFDTAHYHVTPSKLEDIDAEAVRWIKHVHINDMPDIPSPTAISTVSYRKRAYWT